MRLLSLRLQNFRQHADTEIHFAPGLTGIIGPNGAGKSTLLEALAWAIYGSAAARGTNDTLRFSRAGGRQRVEVELRFEMGGHEYRVVRSLNSAEVFLDGGSAPVASTLGGATAFLQGRLGMSREEFFNTYFTGQKELQFLASMGSTERGRFLSQVLGYERLRRAQDLARTRRSELRSEIRALRAALGDLDAIRAERVGAEQRMGGALAALSTAETELADAAERAAELAPRWGEAQAARERYRELSHAIEGAERERETARREIARAQAEIERIAQAEQELAGLQAQLAPLPAVARENERLSEVARKDERRRALSRQMEEMEVELERARERRAQVEQAPELERRYRAELEELRADRARTETEREERNAAWLRDRQDAETKLQQFRDRGMELKEQIRQLRELGPKGSCPTCGRPVGDDFQRLHDELEEQWAAVVQDGKWWASRAEQLRAKPGEVVEPERRLAELSAAVDDKARKQAKCERAVQELRTLQGELEKRTVRRDELRRELEGLPAQYDPERHRTLQAELQALRALETRAARLEETTGRRGAWERDRTDARVREEAAASRGTSAAEEREGLGFSEAAFGALRSEYERASQRLHEGELRVTTLRGQLQTAEQVLQGAQRAEAQFREREREVEGREEEWRYHEELDDAFSELRAELNAQLRPELSEIASLFLAQLTEGRYTAMEIDDAYNILVLDEGEEKPVISGGEEDIANLVLRLSLSQMIAERAGHPLSLLILDEVFGSLDVARRDNVVQLLHHLEDRFEQVILITHIEGIRESLDQVVRVEFDERTGASTVRSESLPGSEMPEEEMAAD